MRTKRGCKLTSSLCFYNLHVINIFAKSARIKQPPNWADCFTQTVLASPNRPDYSWLYSRGHCHGGFFCLFFFTSVNWKSKENESKYLRLVWAIGLTLIHPQTANWRNSLIYVMWNLSWWENKKYWNLWVFIYASTRLLKHIYIYIYIQKETGWDFGWSSSWAQH